MNNILMNMDSNDLKEKQTIKENTKLDLLDIKRDLDVEFNIKKDVILIINMFSNKPNIKIKMVFNMDTGSTLIFNNSFISTCEYNEEIYTNLNGNDISTNVNIRGINNTDSNSYIKMDGKIEDKTTNNKLNEYAKVINKGAGEVRIVPNLLVDAYDVEANHGAAICNIDEDDLFYLMSKGINKEKSVKLLEDNFILEIMEDDVKEKIRKKL